MPEGPEVRTIVEQLNAKIKGNRIEDIIFGPETDTLTKPGKNAFKESVVGTKINDVERFGKYILIKLDNDLSILTHLLITGRLSLNNENAKPKFFRAGFTFDNGDTLYLGDTRRWTKLELLPYHDVIQDTRITSLGTDVYTDAFTNEKLAEALNSKKAVHSVLLDQKKISGLGNIYANECLYMSKIHPNRPANSVTIDEIELLFKNIIKIMELAYQEGGTTIFSFMEKRPGSIGWHLLDGSPGGFWKHVKIFDQAGSECHICNTMIQGAKVNGRGVYYCPVCQPHAA